MGLIIDTPDTEFHLEARRESFCIGAMEFDESCKKTGKVFISHAQYDDKLDNGREASIEATWSELDGLIDGLLRLRAHATEQGVLPPRPESVTTPVFEHGTVSRSEPTAEDLDAIANELCVGCHEPTPRGDCGVCTDPEPKSAPEPARTTPEARASAIDSAIAAFIAAGTTAALADLHRAVDAYARGTLGALTDKVAEALSALTGRRLAGTTKLPAFVKMLQEQGRTDVQLEQLLADVFEGLVTHLHTRGDPETMIHTCRAEDIDP